MEWLERYGAIIGFIIIHGGYLFTTEAKKVSKLENHDHRLNQLEHLNETGLAAKCQVHSLQLQNIERRLDRLERVQ